MNGEGWIVGVGVGVGLDLMISEHSSFDDHQINRSTDSGIVSRTTNEEDGLFEGPGEGCSPLAPDVPAIEVPLCRNSFSATC